MSPRRLCAEHVKIPGLQIAMQRLWLVSKEQEGDQVLPPRPGSDQRDMQILIHGVDAL